MPAGEALQQQGWQHRGGDVDWPVGLVQAPPAAPGRQRLLLQSGTDSASAAASEGTPGTTTGSVTLLVELRLYGDTLVPFLDQQRTDFVSAVQAYFGSQVVSGVTIVSADEFTLLTPPPKPPSRRLLVGAPGGVLGQATHGSSLLFA